MRARRYQDKDFDSIQSWLVDERKCRGLVRSWLPKRGWIVDDVACVFLMKTDSKVGILNFFITNPKISEEVRLQACDLLIVEAEAASRKLGQVLLIGTTKILKVKALLLRYGYDYDPEPYNFFSKHLNGVTDERRSSGTGEQCATSSPTSAS